MDKCLKLCLEWSHFLGDHNRICFVCSLILIYFCKVDIIRLLCIGRFYVANLFHCFLLIDGVGRLCTFLPCFLFDFSPVSSPSQTCYSFFNDARLTSHDNVGQFCLVRVHIGYYSSNPAGVLPPFKPRPSILSCSKLFTLLSPYCPIIFNSDHV